MHIITSTEEEFVNHLVSIIRPLLSQSLTFFMSGGSAIAPEAKIIDQLAQNKAQIAHLTILPVDERYGAPFHSDANLATLVKLLSQDAKNINIIDILDGQDLNSTTKQFQQLFEKYIDDQQTLAILGLGNDGHIAGILPGSPADLKPRKSTAELYQDQPDIVSYLSKPHTRITLTAQALQKIDQIFVYAFGQNKSEILTRLVQDTPSGLPMDILRNHPNVTIFTDNHIKYKGDK